MENTEVDNRVEMELNLDKEDLHQLMLLAHQNDIITLNKMVEKILVELV